MPRKIKLIFNPTANLRRAWPLAALLQPIVQEFNGEIFTGLGSNTRDVTIRVIPAAIQVILYTPE